MSIHDLDIGDSLAWEEGLPHPQWDLIAVWVESQGEPERRRAAWLEVGRQWMSHLSDALGEPFKTVETEHFLLLGPDPAQAVSLVTYAERSRSRILSVLGSTADFQALGKQVAIAFRDKDDYYRYLARFHSEGEYGTSAGMHIREGYVHIVQHGKDAWVLENTLAHELTHAALYHLGLPQWVEEGLAMMFGHDMSGRGTLAIDGEMARRHKKYWGKHGLDAFWRGEGFSQIGKAQELSYQLAEILARLMVEEARPRWFGFVTSHQQRYFAFLQNAAVEDCGEAACREHLDCGLSDLAARFLGEGEWSPSL